MPTTETHTGTIEDAWSFLREDRSTTVTCFTLHGVNRAFYGDSDWLMPLLEARERRRDCLVVADAPGDGSSTPVVRADSVTLL